MDLATIGLAVMLMAGVLGTDAVMNAGSVSVEVAIAPKLEEVSIDRTSLALEFESKLHEVLENADSVIPPPKVKMRSDQGVGIAIAEAVGLAEIPFALQREFGFTPDSVRFALFMRNGQTGGLISGHSHLAGNFSRILDLEKGEPLKNFIDRSAQWAAVELAPYHAALNLMKQHAKDLNFTEVEDLIETSKAMLPPTPTSLDRSMFNNLEGLIAMFKGDLKTAQNEFNQASLDDPSNPVPFLNAAFAHVQMDEYRQAVDGLQALLRLAPPADTHLLGTTYMTLGAAYIGLNDHDTANRMFRTATKVNPHSATCWHLWAIERGLVGDQRAVAFMNQRAGEESATFENYGELAALYFRHSVESNAPLARNDYGNPTVVRFHN
jgi:Tfp pilus assembly protein PilF